MTVTGIDRIGQIRSIDDIVAMRRMMRVKEIVDTRVEAGNGTKNVMYIETVDGQVSVTKTGRGIQDSQVGPIAMRDTGKSEALGRHIRHDERHRYPYIPMNSNSIFSVITLEQYHILITVFTLQPPNIHNRRLGDYTTFTQSHYHPHSNIDNKPSSPFQAKHSLLLPRQLNRHLLHILFNHIHHVIRPLQPLKRSQNLPRQPLTHPVLAITI